MNNRTKPKIMDPLLLGKFEDSQPGYYQQIVRPLLYAPSNRKLIRWLRNTDLIRPMQMCSKKTISGPCNSPMVLTTATRPDLFEWKCTVCPKRKSIWEDSIFNGISCDIKDAIRILLAWCKGYHVNDLGNMLGVNNSVIEELYIRASGVVKECMKSHIDEWQVGGPGVIVLVDTYPEGCTNTRTKMSRPILCILEVKIFITCTVWLMAVHRKLDNFIKTISPTFSNIHRGLAQNKTIPQKYWLEVLDRHTCNNVDAVNSQKRHILATVKKIVRPGSILIIPATSSLCSLDDFLGMQQLYMKIVSTDTLSKHNNAQQNLLWNLEVIWKKVLDICKEAQFYCSSYVDLFIESHMWSRVHGDEAFEMLLYQMSMMQ